MFQIRLALISLLAAFLLSIPPTSAGQNRWTEVKSPNFRVLTDGSESSGRRVAREFEQMRAVFAVGFPNMRLESGAPLLIFAPRDEECMRAMMPIAWKHGPSNMIAGYFHHGWERQFAVIRLDQDIPEHYQVVYHEYVHTLLHANFQWLPTWLDEGLAEYYGNTRFEQSKMYVGAPSKRVYALQGNELIPISELISENPWRKFGKNEHQVDLFYSEAWALVHFMEFGEGMERGAKLSRFYALLQKGEPQKKAFEEVFGNFKDVEDAFIKYTYKFAFASFVVSNPPRIQEKDFSVRQLSKAETLAELGAYQLWSRDNEDARKSIDQALKEDPGSALAHETLAFLNFADGKDADAASEFATAYDADRQRYLSLFYRTMLSGMPKTGAPADQAKFRNAISDVLKVNPQFAPAYVELAFANASQGDLASALLMARKAEGLEPSRAGYLLLSARILLDMRREEDAAKLTSFVAERWRSTDHNEAVELWKQIPAEKRGSGVFLLEEAPEGTKAFRGTLQSVTCAEKGQGATLAIEKDGTLQTFRTTAAHGAGFSDTLWYGEDHFNLCHHIEGLRVVVRYKPAADKALAGEWVELEVRVDLPPLPDKKPESVPTPQN